VRRRVLALVLATTVFAVGLMGAMLVAVVWTLTSSSIQSRADLAASSTATQLEEIVLAGGVPTSETLSSVAAQYEAEVVAHLPAPDGSTRRISAGGPVSGGAWVATATDEDIVVTVRIPTSVGVASALRVCLLVLAAMLVTLAAAALFALVFMRRLSRPFDAFRDAVVSIASGDRRKLGQRYGVEEIDLVAEVLDVGVARFDEMIERERRATQDATHQLKSPLTAISMRLEEIVATDDLAQAREDAAAALGQVERLSHVVDEVVGVMRGQRSSMPVDFALDDLADEVVADWTKTFEAAGRSLHRAGRCGHVVHAERGAQSQTLATLLENSLAHGAGPTTVRSRSVGGWAVVEVGDEGPGIPADLEATVFDRRVSGGSSSGLGLALARTLVSADGGRLELTSARPAVFSMFLPVSTGTPQGPASAEQDAAQADDAIAASSALS